MTQAWPVDAAGGGEGRLLGISWVGVLRVVPFGQVELTASQGPIAALTFGTAKLTASPAIF